MQHTEIAIAGAGVIGLTLALELKHRGADVTIYDAGRDGIASRAAAGMLAVYDPHHPDALVPLAERSAALYPALLQRIASQSGQDVPIHTRATLQQSALAVRGERVSARSLLPSLTQDDFYLMHEHSLDPRQLYSALRAASLSIGIQIEEDEITQVQENATGVEIRTRGGVHRTKKFVDCMGAWSTNEAASTEPVKGQMLRVAMEGQILHHAEFGNMVVRTDDIYMVPRLDGTALIGATVEVGSGYDTHVEESTIATLREKAARLLPSVQHFAQVETWAGLRPKLHRSDLPLITPLSEKRFASVGHFRNGILLAPASAEALAEILEGKASPAWMNPFLLPSVAR